MSLGPSVEIVLGGGGVGTLAALVQGVAVLVRVCTTGNTLYAVGSTRKFDKDCCRDNVLFSVSLSTTAPAAVSRRFRPYRGTAVNNCFNFVFK